MKALFTVFDPISKDFRRIKETNRDAALEWRLKTRKIFKSLFHQGWIVTAFKKMDNPKIPVHFYILNK